jgi:nitric oxide dioxygenase
MLTERSRPVIQATLPVVGQNITTIAERFYEHLFGEHPELVDGLFNRGNQAEGTQQQAPAGSVALFANALVEHPDRLPEQLLSRIAHKHASLGLRADQYQVVHDHLMWAVVDVLGDAVTPEVAAAWDEVYWLMARALINQERGLYSARGVRAETVWREWEPRQYSLTRADDGEHRSFAVKRVRGDGSPAGEVSNLLHDRIQVGDRLTLSLPYGDVVLDDSGHPVVFASAGIGVAPMAGMLSHLAAAGSRLPITVLHADLDEESFPLRQQVSDEVRALSDASMYVWYEHGPHGSLPVDGRFDGTMDLDDVELPEGAEYYLCGPLPFMRALRSALLDRGVRPSDIQYEVFGPDLWQADAD